MDDQQHRLATETVEQEKELAQLHAFADALLKQVEELEASNTDLNSTTPGYADCADDPPSPTGEDLNELRELMDKCHGLDAETRQWAKDQLISNDFLPPPPYIAVEIESGLFDPPNRGALKAKVLKGWTQTFGYVCDDYFDHNDQSADVACRSMGYAGGKYYDPGHIEGSVFSVDDVQCTGSEADISACPGWTQVHNCGNHEVAGVLCMKDVVIDIETDFQKGFKGNTGNLRAKVGPTGEWGYVCGGNHQVYDTACQTLGFSGGMAVPTTYDRRWGNRFSIGNVNCPPGASSFDQCSYDTVSSCGSTQLTLHCISGVKLSIEGGSNRGPLMAIVGNKAGGRMGYVCDDHFDIGNYAARVACKQMGWEDGRYWDPNNKHWSWSVRYAMDDVRCTGQERTLDQCSFIETHNCYSSEVAGVECLGHRVMPAAPPGRSTGPAALHTLYRGHGWCLDYHGGNDNVYLHSCHGGANQVWYINEHNELKSQATGMCLDQHLGNNNAFMHPCHGGNNQKWYMDDLGQIKTLHDHRCLDYSLSFVQVAAEVEEEPQPRLPMPSPKSPPEVKEKRTAALERVRAKVAAAPSPAPTPAISPVTHAKEEDSHAGDAAATPTFRSVCELNPWEPTAEECEHYATTYSCDESYGTLCPESTAVEAGALLAQGCPDACGDAAAAVEAALPAPKKAKSYALQSRLRAISQGMAHGTLKKTLQGKWRPWPTPAPTLSHNVYLHDCHGGTNQQWQFR
jgi:hypothetical protein